MDCNSVTVINEAANTTTLFWIEMLGNALIVVLVAGLAYWFGLRTFFKQREHEQIMKRYLDEGVDRISGAVAEVFRVYFENHFTALRLVTQLKDLDEIEPSVKFHRLDLRNFEPAAYYKLIHLIGDPIVGFLADAMLSFVHSHSAFIEMEMRSVITRIHKKGIDEKVRKRALIPYEKDLKKNFVEFTRFADLMDELQMIAAILEKETTLTWADLGEFKNRIEIKESVKRMKQKYAEIQKIQTQQLSKINK